MPDIEINDLASIGVVHDLEGYQLPPEAWTLANNMRFSDAGAERLIGKQQKFGTLSGAPHFLFPVKSASQVFWMYMTLTKGYVWDGSTHSDITNTGADYSASASREWNGTLLGGVPILNNGVDEPQQWDLNTGNEMTDLTNWPTNDSCRVMRAFGPYLMAFDVTDGGTRYPHLVKWSHPADPGSVPSSWDVTDATKDAGQFDLPDTSAGIILDAFPLSGQMYVYKESSTWQIRLVGGRFVFDNKVRWVTSGILAPRCVTLTADGRNHVVATQDDFIIHNGSNIQSILDKRFKRYLFNQIDTTNYLNCFSFTNPFRDEIWFCYPSSGSTNPDMALIWSYKEGSAGALSEAEVDFRHAAVGNIESASDDTWATVSGTWATYSGPWSISNRRRVLVANTDDTKIQELDTGTDNDGETITGTLQRTGLGVVDRKRSGEWIVDFTTRKLITRVWIKAEGGPIDVRVGFQELVDGSVTWSEVKSFDPDTDKWVDIVGSGLAIAIEFSSTSYFRVTGYKLTGDGLGRF